VPTVEGPVTVCSYTGATEVIVRYQVGETASQFAADKSSMTNLHQSVSIVNGLGDGAFLARYGSGKSASDTLVARKGAIAIFITAPVALAAERTLMTKLLTGI
jgi:hypothetical protein